MNTDNEHYTMNMICSNCDGHSTMSFKRGEPCKYVVTKEDKKAKPQIVTYLCPHCGCTKARATTRAVGI